MRENNWFDVTNEQVDKFLRNFAARNPGVPPPSRSDVILDYENQAFFRHLWGRYARIEE